MLLKLFLIAMQGVGGTSFKILKTQAKMGNFVV